MAEVKKGRGSLADFCQYLKGVGPARAERFKKLGVETVEDLLTHFPRTYYDRRNLSKISSLQPGTEVSFAGQLLTIAQRRMHSRRGMVTAAVGDDTGVVQIVWFNQPYLARRLKPGTELILIGELTHFRGTRQVVNPEFEIASESFDEDLIHTGRIVPVYPLTSGVSQRGLRGLVASTLDNYRDAVSENLPESLLDSADLPDRYDALQEIHFPSNRGSFDRAVERLKHEELFFMQLVFSLQREARLNQGDRPSFNIDFNMEKAIVESLPFELTVAQKRVMNEMRADLQNPRGMNRLLQGDVGSGKTIVAGTTLASAVEAGFQAALMAPTEILSMQHARTLSPLFDQVGIRLELLIGSLKATDKRRIHAGIADGSTQVVIGTHALIQDDVHFKKLGLVIIDEQHRFGVRQRAALLGQDARPHLLVMTATPIPRTLALTAYADLDLSVIDEMPSGRLPVKTRMVTPGKREAMYRFVRAEIEKGHRAYFLYPAIEETEKQDLEAATSAHEELSKGMFSDIGIGLLHGRMSFADKDRVMTQFSTGDVKLLVSTTVVEVGVHVPEATIMVVHHPERFGLSQLHQLRGRVGRGGESGFCFLLVGEEVPHIARDRLRVMTQVSDGFKIAEEDLRIRGPGEFLGNRQHGVPGLKLANPLRDHKIVETVRDCVKSLIERDPHLKGPEGAPCRRHLEEKGMSGGGPVVG
ncbi:MAG: ATP-dependent DNA helicase RecG [bacterium]|nr:ATP-dependent DNA helicase RecG [bacterium]